MASSLQRFVVVLWKACLRLNGSSTAKNARSKSQAS